MSLLPDSLFSFSVRKPLALLSGGVFSAFPKSHQRRWLLAALILAGVFAGAGCRSTFQTEAPKRMAEDFQAERELSDFNIPVSINLPDLAANLNSLYKSVLYEDLSFEDNGKDNLMLRIEKTAPIRIGSQGGKITLKLPMKLKVKYRLAKKVLGVDLGTVQDANLNVTLNLSSRPELGPDWKPRLTTTTDIQWDDLSDFNFGMDISKGINEILKGQIQKISKMMDEQVVKSFNLKGLVEEQWARLHEPMLLDEALGAWLVIEPKLVYLTPFACENNQVDFEVGFKSFIGMTLGEKPAKPKVTALPELMIRNDLKEDFSLSLGADLGFRQMEKLINAQIADSTFYFDDNKSFITIHGVEVYGSNGKLILGVDLKGRVKSGLLGKRLDGRFYFQGVPVYNADKKTISVSQFDFDLQSRDVLLKAAKWMVVNKRFRQNMEKKMVFPVSDQLKQAQRLANQAVNQRMNGFVDLSGEITELEPGALSLTDQFIRLNIKAKGKIKVSLDRFNIR